MTQNMQRTKSQSGLTELWQRLAFLALALLIYRVGAHIPVPGIDPVGLKALFDRHQSILGLVNLFSGGALSKLTVFALGVMPYISASIIIQLLTSVWPVLEQLKKEGQTGRRKISQYTRYATIVLASFQALGMAKLLSSQGIALEPGPNFYFLASITLVTGTFFLMWLGEQITERGLGNGISLIILAGIVSGLPGAFVNTFEKVQQGEIQILSLLFLMLVIAAVIAFVVFIERGQRKILVNYAKRQQGRKIYAAQKSHLPLKLNMAGVIPPIFASSIILFPATIAQWFNVNDNKNSWLSRILTELSPGHALYFVLFSAAVIFFCFFYTSLTFNPKETADNLRKSGGFLPGIRPGDQTADYINKVVTRLTLIGSIYIALVALLPEILVWAWKVPFYFGGTSLLIIVLVVMDFMAQVQSYLMTHQYESLMKKAALRDQKKSW